MRVVLREVLRRARLRAPSQSPERPQVRHVTVVPARGCRVVAEEALELVEAPAKGARSDDLGAAAPHPVG
jgi:hypothetical protein